METPARFREAGENHSSMKGRWDCGYLLARYLRHDITSRISSKRRSIASPIGFSFVRTRRGRHRYRAQEKPAHRFDARGISIALKDQTRLRAA